LRRRVPTLLLVLSAGCGIGESSWDEVARARSPDGLRDAVLIESNGGATTSFGYEIFVVPHAQQVRHGAAGSLASLYAATRNEQAYGVNLQWLAPDTLAVEYLTAREAVGHHSAIADPLDQVHIVLRSGVRDSSAPAGGMLYNREQGSPSRPNDR